MPSPTTALEIIQDALGLTNAVGVDQTLTADETSDCLRAFNNLLEIFSTRNLAVYGLANQTFNTVAGTDTYTFGTAGTWSTTRPVRINSPAYSTISGTTYPCVAITQEEYNLISYKAQTQEFPDYFLFVNAFPLARLTLWPVPSAITAVTFSIDRTLSAVSNAATSISFPPGYAMVFTYKLAIMLAPMFGKKIAKYPDIVSIASDSFADICRANKKLRVMQYDEALLAGGGQTLQRFIGGY